MSTKFVPIKDALRHWGACRKWTNEYLKSTLGEALAAVVQPIVTLDGSQGFSVLGEGQFELETSSDVREISVSELSTGLSASVPLRMGPPAAPQKQPQKIDLVAFAVDFLVSPTGTLATITLSVVLLIWAMTRVALAIRR